MRTFKKSFMVLLMCCLTLLVLPVFSTDVQAETLGEWEYTVESGVATVTKYTGTAAAVEVPAFLDVYYVQKIGEKAFAENKTVTKVVLPDGITDIGQSAFENCAKLKTVTMPNSLVNIYRYAFSGCVSLESIRLPEKVKLLDEKAFMNCVKLTKITVEAEAIKDLNYITYFYDKKLNNYCQPFYGCGTAADGITVTFTESCRTIPAWLFYAFEGEAGAPKVTKVVIKNGTTDIHEYAFRGCKSLTGVSLPNSLEKIGAGAFEDCVRLKKITLPNSLKHLGRYASLCRRTSSSSTKWRLRTACA